MKKTCLPLLILFVLDSSSYGQENDHGSLLWRVDSRGADSPSYLFGTIHVPQQNFVVYSDSLYSAIQHTRMLYNEVDFRHQRLFTDTTAMNTIKAMLVHFDSVVRTPSWKKMIERINRRYNLQLDPDSIDQFVAYSQKFVAETFTPDPGMDIPDKMLAAHAVSLGKETGGLEEIIVQIKMMYELIDARIADTTLGLEDENKMMNGLKKFYLEENMDSIVGILSSLNSNYRDIVFNRRNRSMTDSMIKHMAEMPCFFAVGVGHLGGNTGVIELLRQRGYTVRPVHSGNKISLLVINSMLRMAKRNNEGIKEEVIESLVDTSALLEPPPPLPPRPRKPSPVKKATANQPPAIKPKIKKTP
jgi:uncharacterized protein YbaP (TraB family)